MHRLVLALVLILATATIAPAQDRVAFANLDLIVSRMPESRAAAEQLQAFEDELQKGLSTKQAYAQQKLVELQDGKASGILSEQKEAEYRTELQKLDREIRLSAADAEKKMIVKNSELMEPVLQRLYDTIERVAKREGYTHVLNTMDGTGRSIVMWAVEERDLTEALLTELGIPLEEEPEGGAE